MMDRVRPEETKALCSVLWVVIDSQDGLMVSGCYKTHRKANTEATKRNLAYGAHRFVACQTNYTA